MADVRLIDANVLPNYKCQVTATIGDRKGPAEMRFVFWQDIEKAPTIDAVPIVRCRECKKRGHDWECPLCWMEWHEDKTRPGVGHFEKKDNTTDDGFCHMGAKMDGGAE